MRVDVKDLLGTPYEQMDCAAVANRVLERLGREARLPSEPPAGADEVWRHVNYESAELGDVALQKKDDGNWGVYVLVDEEADLWATSIPEYGVMCMRVRAMRKHIHSFWRCAA